MSGQASLRRWHLKWVLCSDQILLLSSEMNSDYLPMKDPLINIEANLFLWTIFFLSTILDCFSAASWHLPRQFQFFQQITLQTFHQPQQNKAVPHRWASFSFPFSPPPRLCNSNWCHQGIDFPSWEVPACAHVAASGRVYWKITKGTQGDRTRLAPRPQGHEVASSRNPGERWWPWGGGASQSWQTPCPALSWQCDASDTCFMGLLGTFHPASRQRRASLTAWCLLFSSHPLLSTPTYSSIQVHSASWFCR